MSTGQGAWLTTFWLLLPKSALANPVRPREPITIRSLLRMDATSTP